MDEILIPLGVVASALNLDAGELAKLATNGVTDAEKQTAVAEGLKAAYQSTLDRTKSGAFDEGHGKATREVLSAKEREFRTKYPSVQGKTLDEMFDNATKLSGTTDWTKDPNVTKELSEREQKIQAKDQELKETQAKYARELATFKMKSTVPGILAEAGFQLPSDPKKQAKLLGLLYTEMTANGVDIRENEADLIPWDTTKDSQLKTSTDYKPLTLKDWTLQHADSIFEKGKPTPHKAPGNKDSEPPAGGGGKFDFSDVNDWAGVYKEGNKIHPNDPDARERREALDSHVRKLQEAGTLK